MIKTIIRMPNDMVMVFDQAGEQVPEYQGRYGEVREGLLRSAPAGAVFSCWLDGMLEPLAVSREQW